MKTIAILDQYRTGVQSSSGVQFETGPVPYINSQEERNKVYKAYKAYKVYEGHERGIRRA